MNILKLGFSCALACAVAVPLAAQQPVVTVEGDNITLRGCIQKADLQSPAPSQTLVWSRSEIMLAGVAAAKEAANTPAASNPVGTTGVSGRVFYWLDDEEDLAKHVGQLVEVKGKMKDFEKGEIEIEPDGEFTKIELKIDDATETARVPSSWLEGLDKDKNKEFDIVTRRIEVDDVKVVGACN